MIFRLFIILSSFIFSDYLGGYSGSNFRYSTNARNMALGNSLISEYNQGFNSFSNPALLSQVKNLEAGMSYFPMSLDRYIQTLSISQSLSEKSGASISLFNSGVSNIQGRNSENESIGEFNSSEGYLMLSFGADVYNKFSFGLNLKAIFNNIDSYSATGIAGDLGFLYKLSDDLVLSGVLNNIFGKYVWDGLGSGSSEEDLLGVNSLGIKYNMLSFMRIEKWNILDANFFARVDHMSPDNLNLFRLRSGLEIIRVMDINPNYKLILRLGQIQNKGVENFDSKILLGLGFKMENIQFDYCLDFGKENEGLSNLFSISFIKKIYAK